MHSIKPSFKRKILLTAQNDVLQDFSNQNAYEMQPARFIFCQYFGLVFLAYCADKNYHAERIVKKSPSREFITEYEWTHINFTWSSLNQYQEAIRNKLYIPEHNALVGVKFYKDKMYLALVRVRTGTPVTLAVVSTKTKQREYVEDQTDRPKRNLLLSPFPSWAMNVQKSCLTFQNVQSMEIDRRGIMWILDGTRINDYTACPPKLVLIDLNNNNKIISQYIFDDDLCLAKGGFLNDIVVDESDGGYAYITDNSVIDPGLIVFSKKQRRAWKVRDKSMYPEMNATNFTVDGINFGALAPIDGIAMSPVPELRNQDRIVYYTSLSGYNLYAVSNRVLRNEGFCRGDQWRRYVKHVGRKSATTDGMIIDNQGNLYYGLIGNNAIGMWNIYESFMTAKEIERSKEIIWPDSFAMDSSGFLYVLCNGIHKYFDQSVKLKISNKVKFRIMKLYTGNKNYMFTS